MIVDVRGIFARPENVRFSANATPSFSPPSIAMSAATLNAFFATARRGIHKRGGRGRGRGRGGRGGGQPIRVRLDATRTRCRRCNWVGHPRFYAKHCMKDCPEPLLEQGFQTTLTQASMLRANPAM